MKANLPFLIQGLCWNREGVGGVFLTDKSSKSLGKEEPQATSKSLCLVHHCPCGWCLKTQQDQFNSSQKRAQQRSNGFRSNLRGHKHHLAATLSTPGRRMLRLWKYAIYGPRTRAWKTLCYFPLLSIWPMNSPFSPLWMPCDEHDPTMVMNNQQQPTPFTCLTWNPL